MVSKSILSVLREAREGSMAAQVSAGKMYLNGDGGVRRDPHTAFYWLQRAAGQGSPEAKRLIGTAIPQSSIKHPAAVLQYYESASQEGSANAALTLSDWLLAGRIPGGDETRAYELLLRAALAGERKAQLRLALSLKAGAFGAGRDTEALRWLEKAALLGSRAAALSLADWHWERHDPTAIQWMDKIPDASDPEHLYRHGLLLLGGGKVEAGARLLGTAAQLSHSGAQLQYGLLHSAAAGRKVTGVPHSLKKAAAWLERSSRNSNAQASYELHRLFRRREFSLKSTSMAQRYLEIAAEQGHAHAQFLTALGCLRDRINHNADVSAAKWFLRAAKQQHAEAGATLRALYRRQETVYPATGVERSQLVRLLARSRIALALRLELAEAFALNAQEMLLFDPESADQGECLVIDIRKWLPRARRRLLIVEREGERALLDRARRLLSPSNPHPTDVRGPFNQRKGDLARTLSLFGARAAYDDVRY